MWCVERCIAYAVTHNHDVRLQSFALKDYKIERTKAVGAFLPAIEGNVGGQYNFGRAIDPETNTYTNVNTFYNSYQLSAHQNGVSSYDFDILFSKIGKNGLF